MLVVVVVVAIAVLSFLLFLRFNISKIDRLSIFQQKLVSTKISRYYIFAHHEIITKQYQQMYDKNEKERISFTQQHIQNKNKFQ